MPTAIIRRKLTKTTSMVGGSSVGKSSGFARLKRGSEKVVLITDGRVTVDILP